MLILPWFWTLVNNASRLLVAVRLRLCIQREGPVPEGPVLLCVKHASGLDIPVFANLSHVLRHDRPYFQMGSFVGYPILGHLVPFMRRLGGFPVLRPKEVLRLRRRRGFDRRRVREVMASINQEAEAVREAVLRSGGTLVVFPEGTRDSLAVRPLVSELEMRTALKLEQEGVAVNVWPAVLSYGSPRFFRRPLVVALLKPFSLRQMDCRSALRRVEEGFHTRFLAPLDVDRLVKRTDRGEQRHGRNPYRT